MNWNSISEQITVATNKPFQARDARVIGGGDINSAYCLIDGEQRYFVKLNRPELLSMFTAESAGLQELANSNTVRVPKPIVYGQTHNHSFLVLEYLAIGRSNSQSARLLGQQLARLHQQSRPYFGWHRDNTIGSTIQRNQQYQDWLAFWREQRLGFQLQLAANKGYGGRLQTLGEKLSNKLTAFFTDYQPVPSLLHGDLWAGNSATDQHGIPVIFDPACYYGDREADLAMTELFGGFGRDFYAAYQETWPLDDGYPIRKTLYNLYHILNHLNLFGRGYLGQAEMMMSNLLAEVG